MHSPPSPPQQVNPRAPPPTRTTQLGKLNKAQLIREIKLHGSFAHRNIVELWCSFQVGPLAARKAGAGEAARTARRGHAWQRGS